MAALLPHFVKQFEEELSVDCVWRQGRTFMTLMGNDKIKKELLTRFLFGFQ